MIYKQCKGTHYFTNITKSHTLIASFVIFSRVFSHVWLFCAVFFSFDNNLFEPLSR